MRKLLTISISVFISLCAWTIVNSEDATAEPLVCEANQFKCSKRCIPDTWRCDGDNDCIDDKTDEENCPKKTCSPDEFQCVEGGNCIPLRWTCDQSPDCTDGSDEKDICNNKTCKIDQFSCGDGGCIPSSWRCDGTPDCSNAKDESCGSPTCASDEHRCDNTKCVTKKWLCDGDDDCGDNSDEEKNCTTVACSAEEFQCADKKCIDKLWQCDGDFDCNDQSDEHNCTEHHTSCTETEWACVTGNQCIHESWKCDGDEDCLDGSDENKCQTTCRPDQFKCNNSYCIYHTLQCDGAIDCTDGSDELNCTQEKSRCPSDQFDCFNNGSVCLEVSKLCNGQKDCPNFADEDNDLCEDNPCNLNNGGCMQKCIPVNKNKHRCECFAGFRLQGNTSCEDIDECQQTPPVCSQICTNEKGSYKCQCMPGYYMDMYNPHHHFCKVIGERPWLFFANRNDVRKLQVDTNLLQPVVEDLHSAVAVDYDFRNKYIYWTDVALERIVRAKLSDNGQMNGSAEVVVKDKIRTPDGIAVDWIYGNVYWTDTGYNTIEVASQDGNLRKTLIDTGLDEPRAIAVDPLQGYMFFSDWGSTPKIERCGMDGDPATRTVIIHEDIQWPNGLTLDYADERIYWIDAKMKSIHSAKLDGSGVRTVVHDAEKILHPYAVTVFEDSVYWTDWTAESIRTVHKFTGENYQQLALGLHSPMDVKIYHEQRQNQGQNYCGQENGKCTHFCLPSPIKKQKYSCACPNGMLLNADGINCRDDHSATSTPITPTPHNKTISPNDTNKNSTNATQPEPSTKASTTTSVVTSKATKAAVQTTEPPYIVVSPGHHKNKTVIPGEVPEGPVGTVAIIAIAVVLGLAIIVVIIGCFIYRKYTKRNIKSMNFDNPVYRKTTEESVRIQRDSALEPLNTDPLEV